MPLLLVLGLATAGSGYWLNKQTYTDTALEPKIFGYDASVVIGGLGLGAALLLSGPIALVGATLAGQAYASYDGRKRVAAGLKESIRQELAAAGVQVPGGPPAQLQLPPPAAPVPDAAAQQQQPGLLDWLLNPGAQPQRP